uniref:C-type lectin domain-containing protein n=1 Tax=Salvator merianae TaxID=96440 RepID=A0A8D0EDL5_SALMN
MLKGRFGSQLSGNWHCLLRRTEGKEQKLSCCMEGWERFESNCYYFSRNTSIWNDSKTKCNEMGSGLVVINTPAEQEFLMKYIYNNTVARTKMNFCIGLYEKTKDRWLWVDGTPLNSTQAFWRNGEPNRKDENCAVMHIDKETQAKKNWNDVQCDRDSHHYICETMVISS